MLLRDRVHALLIERGPMKYDAIAEALGVANSTASNAAKSLVDIGRARQTRYGAPYEAIPGPMPPPVVEAKRVDPPAPPPALAVAPARETGRATRSTPGPLDIERISEEAARFASGPFGYLLWLDALCASHPDPLRRMPSLSPWWRHTLGAFYASGKRWGIFCVGRGGGKSSSLEKVAAEQSLFAPRVVYPGQTWIWPFISVNPGDATRRLRGIAAIYKSIGLRVIGEYDGGEKVKDGVKVSLSSPAHMDLLDARGNSIQLLSLASTVANVSGPSTIGATIDEAAKLFDRTENANPLTEIFASLLNTFRARPGIKAIMCSSAMDRSGLHYRLVHGGDTEMNFVARIGRDFLQQTVDGFEQVAAWEQRRGEARAAAEIRTHAASLTAESPLVPTWVANPTLGNPSQGEPWEWAALASRKEADAMPEEELDGMPRWAFWLRENGSVPMDRAGGFDVRRQIEGLAEANAMLARSARGAPPVPTGPRPHPLAPPGDPRYAGPRHDAGSMGNAFGRTRLF